MIFVSLFIFLINNETILTMNKPVITAQQLAALYPTSHKVVSEKLSPEEYAIFTDEAAEVNARLEAQGTGNMKLTEDLATANAATKKAEDEATLLKADKIKQEAEITRLKAYESKVLEITSKGKDKPEEDLNSRNDNNVILPENHPNSVALAAYKAAKGIK